MPTPDPAHAASAGAVSAGAGATAPGRAAPGAPGAAAAGLGSSADRLRAALPGLPCDSQGPVFAEPWQAQVFALTLALHEGGHFDWPEWTRCLSAAIRDAQARGDADAGDTYYQHWLSALEQLLLEKRIAQPLALTSLRQAWRVAAEATPHGQPIELGAAARARLRGFARDARSADDADDTGRADRSDRSDD